MQYTTLGTSKNIQLDVYQAKFSHLVNNKY